MPYYVPVADATAGLSTVCFGDEMYPVVGTDTEAPHIVLEDQNLASVAAEIIGLTATDITDAAPEASDYNPVAVDGTSPDAPEAPQEPDPPPVPGLGLGQPLDGDQAATPPPSDPPPADPPTPPDPPTPGAGGPRVRTTATTTKE